MPRELCHAAHYNIVAKRIREGMPIFNPDDNEEWVNTKMIIRGTLTDLALEFAKWFQKDNPKFDPIKFLQRCSNEPELYPLEELWDGPTSIPVEEVIE